MKKFLGVHMRTPNDLVYGKTGRYPIYLNSYIRCTNYSLKIVRMEEHRLPCITCYLFWMLGVKRLGSRVFEWWCPKNFRQRLIDCRWQNWDDHIQKSDNFSLDITFKLSSNSEMYPLLDINRHIKCSMTRFRFGISDIAVHHKKCSRWCFKISIIQTCKRWCALFTLLSYFQWPQAKAYSTHVLWKSMLVSCDFTFG